ncbi:MAG: ParA family protein [Fusobacteriaceae bacterium]|jgi:chromosome partitioning protein|nr:ParA family protein [Fusobacteriaceae bacterium]
MGKIIIIKNNKGGVGKTFLTAQLGTGLAAQDKRTLILTSDSQNNILDYLYQGFDSHEFDKGLKAEVNKKGDGEKFKLRDNLYFIPLESNRFSSVFIEKLPLYLDDIKKEYDYILIDSVPTLKIDQCFLELADKVIIPLQANAVNVTSTIQFLKELNNDSKVAAIIINQFSKTAIKMKYKEVLETALAGKIPMLEPINNLAFIDRMLDRRKSIWEYNSVEAQSIQINLFNLINLIQ